MKDFFAALYEWFGVLPFYSKDMGDELRGWDSTCTDFIATPWYVYIGWVMILITVFVYALQYHIIDSSRYNKKRHWWLFALIIVVINFLFAFIIPYNTVQAGDYCNQLKLGVSDCIGFGFSNAIWSLLLFLLISSIPLFRRFSRNCRHTTFWKP